MRIASVLAAVGLAAAAFALPAAAQNKGFYIGYNAGQSKYNFNCTGTCSDTGGGYTLFAGFGLHPNVAAEFGYTDLGKSTFGSANLRAQMWHGAAVGTWWFGSQQQFGAFGRLGVYTGDAKATVPSTGGETKHGTTDLLYGLGGQWNLSSKFGARLEWMRFTGVGGGGFNQTGDVDLLALGLLYKF